MSSFGLGGECSKRNEDDSLATLKYPWWKHLRFLFIIHPAWKTNAIWYKIESLKHETYQKNLKSKYLKLQREEVVPPATNHSALYTQSDKRLKNHCQGTQVSPCAYKWQCCSSENCSRLTVTLELWNRDTGEPPPRYYKAQAPATKIPLVQSFSNALNCFRKLWYIAEIC